MCSKNGIENNVANLTGLDFNKNEIAPCTICTSLKKADINYKMDHESRGLAVIFNHETFEEETEQKRRKGADKDADRLEGLFVDLGFSKISIHKDYTRSQIFKRMDYIANKTDHRDFDCLFICILTHGGLDDDDNDVLWAKDKSYYPKDLWSQVRASQCPSLAGKPKIFLMQACRGYKYDKGVTISSDETDSTLDQRPSYQIPDFADFLLVYSTAPGFVSWRNEKEGSWFIKVFCEIMQEKRFDYDLVTILTYVSQCVVLNYESYNKDPEKNGCKQIPCATSFLTRLIRFPRKEKKTDINSGCSGLFLSKKICKEMAKEIYKKNHKLGPEVNFQFMHKLMCIVGFSFILGYIMFKK